MLWTYTVSCHSCRHIIGGRLRNFSAIRCAIRRGRSCRRLNAKHMQLAWTTLGTLMITDGYIALVSSGAISDLRIIN